MTLNSMGLGLNLRGDPAGALRPLVRPYYINPDFNFTRASAGWGFVDGVLTAFGTNMPRWVDAPNGKKGLLIEPARTNLIRNPRGEGAVVGNPGTDPTNWVRTNNACTSTIAATGTTNGIFWVEYAVTATGAGDWRINFDGTGGPPSSAIVAGTVFVGSCAVAHTAALPAQITLTSMRSPNTSNATPGLIVPTDGVPQYKSNVFTGASTQATNPLAYFVAFNGVCTFNVRLGIPQFEFGSTPTSIILPVVGTPAATTRAADSLLATNLPWLNASQGTVFIESALSSGAIDAANRSIFSVSDGGTNNRLHAFYLNNNNPIALRHNAAGVSASAPDAGSISTNLSRMAFGYGLGSNGVGVSLNGATPSYASPAAAPTGMNQFHLGGSFLGDSLNGVITEATYRPSRDSDAKLMWASSHAATSLLSVNSQFINPLLTFSRASAGWNFVNGVFTAFGTNTPRWSSNGLLLEGARANLLTNSAGIDTGTWSKTDITVLSNTLLAPDGTLTADKIVGTNGVNGGHNMFAAHIFAASGAKTFSVFAKAGEFSRLELKGYNATNGNQFVTVFDVSTGTVISGTGVIESVGSGWYRLSCTGTFGAIYTQFIVTMLNASNSFTFTGDGSSGLYLGGAQTEDGAFASSHIPTTSTSITRASDALTGVLATLGMPSSGLGTYVFDITVPSAGVLTLYPALISLNQDASTFLIFLSGNSVNLQRNHNSSSITEPFYGPAVAGARRRVALALDGLGGATFSVAGLAPLSVSAGPTSITQITLGSALFSTIHSVSFYPTRLTNAQLQALST